MRKFHRWLSIVFGVALLWISATGVLSQVGNLVNQGGFEHEHEAAPVTPPGPSRAGSASAAAAFACPEDMICRPKPKPGGWNIGLLHHLHSGESFGPLGTVISILSGLALLFFALSGLWMYVEMFRNRRRRNLRPGWFWD
jgi:uncharacterized iron-regulated membrane protein